MKITVDEKQCLRHKLTIQEVLIALALKNTKSYTEVLENLILREIITYKNGQYHLTEEWDKAINQILLDSSGSIDDEERLRSLAKEMQKCFPEGKSPGTPYYYRCNVSEVMKKLKKFFELFGNFSDDDIIDATRRYVASYNGDYRRLRLIKYFILKDAVKQGEDGLGHVEQVSDLLTYLENKADESDIIISDDWLMSARN